MDTTEYENYRSFLEYFAKNVDPTDQLPVRVPNYTLDEDDINGAVVDWVIQYLTDKKCPQTLVAPILRIASEQTQQALKKSPEQYGYSTSNNEYQPLKLMQLSISKINDVCQSLLDNLQLDTLIPPPPAPSDKPPRYSAKGVKNTRRHMEDRHIIIDDFNSVFGIKESDRTRYYAIFDGHGGTDAAAYCVSHLHSEIAASPHYPARPAEALREAFMTTDDKFIEKSKKQKLVAGTTALVALFRPVEQRLYVGWVGDSKALLVSQNRVLQIVKPHKPESESEQRRIEASGGCVILLGGCLRVNGRLAVSRAIGDYGLKDVVIGVPDIVCIPFNGNEDFLVMACDGLWDFVHEDELAFMVYEMLEKNDGDVQPIAAQLIELAKKGLSSDNISIIVVFFKDPKQIIYEYNNRKSLGRSLEMDVENTNGCHMLGDGLTDAAATTPSPDHLNAIDDYKLMDLKPVPNATNLQQQHSEFIFGNGDGNFNGGTVTSTTTITTSTTKTANGNGFDDDEHDDDFGPETDVDATDDAAISPLSPSLQNTKIINNELNNENLIGKFNENDSEFFIEKTDDAVVASNPFGSNEQILKKDEDFNVHENQMSLDHRFDDNRFLDNMSHDNFGADDNEFHGNKIDFSEKKEYSFEREDYEKELDPIGDVPADLIAISKEAAVAAADDEKEESVASDSTENIIESPMGEVITTEQHVLPTNDQVPIENVVVAESGDDSDDEWNYIPVTKSQKDTEKPHNNTEKEIEDEEEEDDKENYKPVDDITSPTPPTASIGEVDIGQTEESHAISQAIAVETEELCTELLDHKQDTEPELLELERADISSPAAQDEDSDMESQLNPDAKEFVPISPQRSSPLSPMSNGESASILNNRPDLLDDDVVAQSPRKGVTQPMDDIVLPSEDDFTEISKRPAELVESPTEQLGRQSANGFNSNEDLEHRPDSSNSQCSYQEMNLKEQMHGDEKQEFAAEIHDNGYSQSGTDAIHEQNEQVEDYPYSIRDQDPMNTSFYKDDNPFNTSVDLNAVRPLPDSEDETEAHQNEVTVVEKKDTGVDEKNLLNAFVSNPVDDDLTGYTSGGAHFIIQDTEFGMDKQHNEANDNILKEEENMYPTGKVINTPDLLEPLSSEIKQNENRIESDQPESELCENFKEHSSITQVVQEMASEVTSILNEFTARDGNISESPIFSNEAAFDEKYIEQPQQHDNEVNLDDVINKSGLSASAHVFNSFETNQLSHSDAALDSLPESDGKSSVQEYAESDSYLREKTPLRSEPVEHITEAVNSVPLSSEPVSQAFVSEPEPVSEIPKLSDDNIELIAASSVAALTAVAAAAATVASKSPTEPKPSKTTDVKKTDVKSKPTSATKKPTTAPLKSAVKSTTGTITAKPTSPTKTAAAKTSTLSAPRTRTVPVKSPVEKKTTTTTTLTKKPLTNGVSSTTTVKKTTSITKTSTGTAKPAVTASKTTTASSAARASSASKPVSTTTARVPLSARTTTKAVPSAATATKTRPTSSVAGKTTSTTAAARPRTTTDKPLLSARTTTLKSTSPSKTTTTTSTVKKLDSSKSPVKTLTKTTTTKTTTLGAATSTTKRPTSTLSSTTRTTTTTAATKKLTPIKKPATTSLIKTTPSKSPLKSSVTTNGSVEKKRAPITKTTSTVVKAQKAADTNGNTFDPLNGVTEKMNGISLENGNAIVSSTITTTTFESFSTNSDLMNSFGNGETNQNAIIDPAAD